MTCRYKFIKRDVREALISASIPDKSRDRQAGSTIHAGMDDAARSLDGDAGTGPDTRSALSGSTRHSCHIVA